MAYRFSILCVFLGALLLPLEYYIISILATTILSSFMFGLALVYGLIGASQDKDHI